MPTLKIDKKSLHKLEVNLKKTRIASLFGGGRGLLKAAQEIMDLSQLQVPFETGTLRNSGFVSGPERDESGRVQVRIGYGGEADKQNPKTGQMASEYMIPVHERLDVQHPIGKAKFFEDPVIEVSQRMGRRIAKEVRDEMAKTLRRI